MSLIKQLIPQQQKFTPASSEVNWTHVNSLVYEPGDGRDHSATNSAVFACLDAISSAYPEPPLAIMRKQSGGKSERIPESPLQSLIDKPTPNGELSIDEIQYWTAWALHADGNAYWLKIRSGNAETGNVIQLWPISPTLMAPVTEPNTNDWISYYKYRIAANQVVGVPVANVIHFRSGLDDKDMRKGISRLKHLVRQIATDDEADKFVASLLKNYAVPGLVIIPQNGMQVADEDEAERISDRFRRKFGDDNRGRVAVMSKESKVEQFGFSPKDLDMSILHRIPEERISAVMGVPAIVAGLGAGLDRATYANFKEAREMFTEQKLVPMWRTNARKLNTSLKPDFTSDKNVYIEFDLTDVRTLQEDEDAKYKRLSTAVAQQPFMTVNEARTDIGLDPFEPQQTAPEPPATPPQNGNSADNQPPTDQQSPKQVDLEKWQRKAIKAVKKGESAAVPFESEYIPDDESEAIGEALEGCETVKDVQALFAVHNKADQDGLLEGIRYELMRANDLLEASNGSHP